MSKMPPPVWYRCKHCRQVVERDSDKAWIKSYCGRVGRFVHLMRTEDDPS